MTVSDDVANPTDCRRRWSHGCCCGCCGCCCCVNSKINSGLRPVPSTRHIYNSGFQLVPASLRDGFITRGTVVRKSCGDGRVATGTGGGFPPATSSARSATACVAHGLGFLPTTSHTRDDETRRIDGSVHGPWHPYNPIHVTQLSQRDRAACIGCRRNITLSRQGYSTLNIVGTRKQKSTDGLSGYRHDSVVNAFCCRRSLNNIQ